MPSYARYQSDVDPELWVEEPNTEEGLLALQARVLAAQAAHPDEARYFIGSCIVVEHE